MIDDERFIIARAPGSALSSPLLAPDTDTTKGEAESKFLESFQVQ
jgi:hypothetical protein